MMFKETIINVMYHCAMLCDECFDDVVAATMVEIVVLDLLYRKSVHAPLCDCHQLMMVMQNLWLKTISPAVKEIPILHVICLCTVRSVGRFGLFIYNLYKFVLVQCFVNLIIINQIFVKHY